MHKQHPGFDYDLATGALRLRQAQPPASARPRAVSAAVRMYSAARNTRNTVGFGGNTSSADAELLTSLASLRNRSRQMVRDAAYAKRARNLVVDNVIGAGVGMQAQVKGANGKLRQDINASIESEWDDWCQAAHCHTGGALHFGDLERAALAQVFEAGDVLIRCHDYAFGNSRVPLALELIESERLADGVLDIGAMAPGAEIRMGIEVEPRFGRALAAWVRQRHPGDIRGSGSTTDQIERVPASQLYHLRVITRWPQTRGEPWLHAVVRKLDDMNECTQLELTAARGASAYFGTIKSPAEQSPIADEEEADGTPVMNLEPLTIQELAPGEELDFHAPNRPNSALDPFMRGMLREAAAGANLSYASLSGDYSQSNYSSSRMGLLEERALWRVLQLWWVRSFRHLLHKRWLQQAVLAGAVRIPLEHYAAAPAKFEAVRFKPRGWTWVDPRTEVNAFNDAIAGGLTTRSDVIAATGEGRDFEDLIDTLKREQQLLAEAGVELPVSPSQKPAAAAPAVEDDEDEPADDGEDTPAGRRVINLRRGSA